MSGAASLAAAKRRRTATLNSGNQSNHDTQNTRPTNQQSQPIHTPMSILTQHHIRLRDIEAFMHSLDNVGGDAEITNFDSRLTRIEQRINSIEEKLHGITSTNEGDNAPDNGGPTFGGTISRTPPSPPQQPTFGGGLVTVNE